MTAPSVITRESDDREPAPSPSRGIADPSPPLGLSLSLGRVQVTERYTGYKVRRHDQILATHPLDLPPTEFPTIGLWLTFDSPSLSHSNPGILDPSTPFLSGLHGAEHALIAIAPLIAMCDPRDFGGASYPLFPGTGKPTILIYDGFENGIGISEKLYAEFERWARTAHDLVARCPCDEGCPACVLSPRCGDGNQPMDKRAALEVLAQLVVTSTSLH
jgi:DEAD/DEAH box helicase domain-containing protein